MTRLKYYFIIVIYSIFQIIGGIKQTAASLPILTLDQNIRNGGIRIKSDNVYIEKVMPLSPAAQAKLVAGDIIVNVNGTDISKSNVFTDIVYENRGKSVDIVINRNGEFKQIQLIPRVNNPPGEGPTGVAISNYKLQKEPLYLLIPKTLFQDISWDLFTVQKTKITNPIEIFFQREYFHPLIFSMGIILIILSIGLIKLRKWAIYGIYILAFIDLVQVIVFITGRTQYDYSISSIFSFSLSILFILYLYSQRKFFK